MQVEQLQKLVIKYLDHIKQIIHDEKTELHQKIEEISNSVDKLTLKVVYLQDDEINNNDNRG